jgi:hypothetical protein
MVRAVKTKKSFTLSRNSVAFLERLRKERKEKSTSMVLDSLIREAAAVRRREASERAITAYYDSLTPEDQAEDAAWATFAESQMTPETWDA